MKLVISKVFVFLILLNSCAPASEARNPQVDVLQTEIDKARQGVSSNQEWEPFVYEIDGFSMALVPAGCFLMGSEERQDEAPIHEVCLTQPYWVDLIEIMNSDFDQNRGKASEESYVDNPNHPRENITYLEATAFCESRGGRLPTEAEWEFAGRGPDSLNFPWGNEFDSTKLNYCDRNCTKFGLANQDPETDDGYAESSPVDAFPLGSSWVGALGLAGNVHEMVSDWYSPNYYAESSRDDPIGPETGRQRTVRGGCWGCPSDGSRLSYRHRSLEPPTGEEMRSIVTGFRCVLPVEHS